ncbi:MAG TPA: AAA family ATPase [Candidatus Lokiarchaeia archaeon]|nr:AAA family ATPase [Candidatus Lokiarchaeia archaeon]
MDEDEDDIFQTEIYGKKSVFRNEQSLSPKFIPEKLHHRETELKTLIHNYRDLFKIEDAAAVNILILGKGGVGKTTTANYFAKGITLTARNNNVKLITEYFSCVNYRTKSAILREILSRHCFQTGKGYSDDETLKQIQAFLDRENAYLIILIDEVYHLPDADIMSLVNISETFRDENPRISVILISREQDWARFETERIVSRIQEKILFQPYNREETEDILASRRDFAFREGVMNDEVFEFIVEATFDTKNIRHGIEMFRDVGKQADAKGEDEITVEMARYARNKVHPTFRGELLDQFKGHELLSLLGVVRKLRSIDEPFVVVEDAYADYCSACEERGIEPHTITTFRKYIRNLTKSKVLNGQTKQIAESQRGRHMEITLFDIPASELETILVEMLKNKIITD